MGCADPVPDEEFRTCWCQLRVSPAAGSERIGVVLVCGWPSARRDGLLPVDFTKNGREYGLVGRGTVLLPDGAEHALATGLSHQLSGPSGTAFESVEALSPTDVWVGGTNGTGPLLEHFNGTSWQVMSTPSSFSGAGVLAMTAKSDSDVWIFSVHNPLTQAVLLANWNGSSWTTSPSPIPADSSVSIGSAASSPSHVWLFGTDDTTGEPMILSHS